MLKCEEKRALALQEELVILQVQKDNLGKNMAIVRDDLKTKIKCCRKQEQTTFLLKPTTKQRTTTTQLELPNMQKNILSGTGMK